MPKCIGLYIKYLLHLALENYTYRKYYRGVYFILDTPPLKK